MFPSLSRTCPSLLTETAISSVPWAKHRHSTSVSQLVSHKWLTIGTSLIVCFTRPAVAYFHFPVTTALPLLLFFLDNLCSSPKKKLFLFLCPSLWSFASYLRPVLMKPLEGGTLPESLAFPTPLNKHFSYMIGAQLWCASSSGDRQICPRRFTQSQGDLFPCNTPVDKI